MIQQAWFFFAAWHERVRRPQRLLLPHAIKDPSVSHGPASGRSGWGSTPSHSTARSSTRGWTPRCPSSLRTAHCPQVSLVFVLIFSRTCFQHTQNSKSIILDWVIISLKNPLKGTIPKSSFDHFGDRNGFSLIIVSEISGVVLIIYLTPRNTS